MVMRIPQVVRIERGTILEQSSFQEEPLKGMTNCGYLRNPLSLVGST